MTPEIINETAKFLATVAAPIYAQRSGTMRERDAMVTSVRDACALVEVAAQIVEEHLNVRRSNV